MGQKNDSFAEFYRNYHGLATVDEAIYKMKSLYGKRDYKTSVLWAEYSQLFDPYHLDAPSRDLLHLYMWQVIYAINQTMIFSDFENELRYLAGFIMCPDVIIDALGGDVVTAAEAIIRTLHTSEHESEVICTAYAEAKKYVDTLKDYALETKTSMGLVSKANYIVNIDEITKNFEPLYKACYSGLVKESTALFLLLLESLLFSSDCIHIILTERDIDDLKNSYRNDCTPTYESIMHRKLISHLYANGLFVRNQIVRKYINLFQLTGVNEICPLKDISILYEKKGDSIGIKVRRVSGTCAVYVHKGTPNIDVPHEHTIHQLIQLWVELDSGCTVVSKEVCEAALTRIKTTAVPECWTRIKARELFKNTVKDMDFCLIRITDNGVLRYIRNVNKTYCVTNSSDPKGLLESWKIKEVDEDLLVSRILESALDDDLIHNEDDAIFARKLLNQLLSDKDTFGFFEDKYM